MAAAATPASGNPRRHPRVLWSRLKSFWTFAVWLLALAAFWLVHEDAGGITAFPGVVETASADIAAVEDGLIREIPVTPGAAVRSGDVVVRMDASVVRAEAALAAREGAESAARLTRQYQQSAYEAGARIRELEADAESARAELAVLLAEVARLEPLVEKRLADPQLLATTRARSEALKVTVERTPAAIAAYQTLLDWAARSLRETHDSSAEIKSAADSRAALASLTAPMDGIVIEIFRHAGTAVPAGEPILRISDNVNSRVRGFLPEYSSAVLSSGDTVLVEPVGPGPKVIPAKVSSLAPQIIEMSEPNILMPSRVVRGRMVWIDLPAGTGLLPGQAVNVRTRPSLLDRLMEKTGSARPAGFR